MNRFGLVRFAFGIGSVFLTHAQVQAQDANTPMTAPRQHIETSMSLGTGAQLTASRVSPSFERVGAQSFDPSVTLLGSVRQSVRPWLGYSANFGYTRTTEENAGSAVLTGTAPFRIPTNVYEVSLAYLVQKHFTPRVTGFADLGAGFLSFLPVHRGATAANFVPGNNSSLVPSYLNHPLGVAAVGLDLHLSRSLALRAEYRGLLYKFPDNHGTVARATTETSQPTVSVVYQFGTKR